MGRKKLARKKRPSAMKKNRMGFRGMTVLELLILPVTLALITVVFSYQQDERQHNLETKFAKNVARVENHRAKAERDLLKQRARDEALQAYLEQMSHLLLEDLRNSKEGSEVQMLARANTLTILERIGPDRRSAVLQFLVEADLVIAKNSAEPIISLADANLKGAVMFEPNLKSADLRSADLENARLKRANLKNANSNKANWLSNKEIKQQVYSFEGATMPNGQKYEDRIKDRERRGEDGGKE